VVVEPVVAFLLAPPHLEDQVPSWPFHRYPGASSLLEAADQEGGDGADGGGGVEVIVVAVAAAAAAVVVVVVDSLQAPNVAVGVHDGPSVIPHRLLEGQ